MAQQQPPEDPRVTAEKMRAEHGMAMLKAKQDFDAAEAEKSRAFDKFMAQLNAEIEAQLDERAQASDARIFRWHRSRQMLAATTMKLQTQKELSYATAGRQVVTPPSEPAGLRAGGRRRIRHEADRAEHPQS